MWWRRIFGWAVYPFTEELIRTYVLPLAAPLGVGLVGVTEEVSPFYLAVGITLAFAAAITWHVRLDEWRYRNRVADKLAFHSPRVGKAIEEKEGWANTIRLGFNVANAAAFPLQFEIIEMHTQFRDQFPPRKPYDKTLFLVPSNGQAWFDDFNIGIPRQDKGVYEGQMRCRLKYGRPRKLRYTLDIHKKVLLKFDDGGNLDAVEWVDQ